MKNDRGFLMISALAITLCLGSCNKESVEQQEGATASLQISIAGEVPKGKASGNSPTLAEENTVKAYTVYVANNSTSVVEAVKEFTGAANGVLTGLTIGAKRIVVVANLPAGIPRLGVGDNISGLNSPLLTLGAQEPSPILANGMVMSGENGSVTLVAGSGNVATVTIKRVAAKVKLGTVTYAPDAGFDDLFTLTNVYIMKAPSLASFGPGATITSSSPYFGGIIGTLSTTVQTYLAETFTTGATSSGSATFTNNEGKFFYVFPNTNTTDATLITIAATYGSGSTVYFPIRINDLVNNTGDANTDATLVLRNYVYTVNVTIKHPTIGSTNPETPIEAVGLTITVTVDPWETDIIQETEI